MSTDCRAQLHQAPFFNPSPLWLIAEHQMNPQQFADWKAQLSKLSPQQLRALQGDIDRSLHQAQASLLTEEEREAIAHLFA
ncbi:hypothetical protein G7083_13415 (plasmid) [Vibrio sp. HDW18]|uniref:hypothetical protein n=1 Tax=Vibrio sp. HDW18 TaxID=2714948 RepID=UPI00140A7AE8|nr:hypothetical protein [Vibrio sp. HDW18]QIL86595.1 hypothetical protein G7083_13415 [Vibrio sp. HDW18]